MRLANFVYKAIACRQWSRAVGEIDATTPNQRYRICPI
jgi:hypothetical protein